MAEPCERCVRDGCRRVRLAGSGTTGLVAVKYGRRFLGCDLNPQYADMAHCRIGKLGRGLFGEVQP